MRPPPSSRNHAATMNQADYIELIDFLEAGLRDAGIPDLSDPSLYSEKDPESGELRRRHPRDHLVELLSALERHLTVTDRRTHDRALSWINQSIDEPTLRDALIMPLDDGDSGPLSLGDMPDLGSARGMLAELIQQIRADPEPNHETDR